MKIGIIGGGASGIVAAIFAKNENNEVIIFERNKECGKKILSTGNGRCNYWNLDQDLYHYQSNEENLINEIINNNSEVKVMEFFDKLGIVPKIKNGYYYPFSNGAITIKNILIKEIERKGIQVKNNFLVRNIELFNGKFVVSNDEEDIFVDKLVVATGSYAAPKTGSDGSGYNFLEKLGHTIVKPLPALVQLKTDGDYLKLWSGVRTEVKLTQYEAENKKREELGELQLTNYGISGICVLNLSNSVIRGLDQNKEEQIFVDFLPFLNEDKISWFISQTKLTNKKVNDLLLAVLNEKIVEIIFRQSKINKNKLFTDLSIEEQNRLINYCTNFKLNITGSNSFDDAQVCSGGVKLSEVDLNTMESKIIDNLYITGELLDITGDCGGYNLGIAWRTGLIAGTAIRGNNND